MTPARWARMKELFSAAAEKPPQEREAFLHDACPDAVLREEVGRLLEAEDRPSLESPVGGILAAPAPPAAIGRYRIVRLLGEGGMGAVYEAEQDQPRRRVALKVIKAGLASPALLRRFEHEAQALGRLHHPGIAQIYEAGAADSGFGPQPYFAMELIQGAPLLRYAQEHRLSTRQRLELMAKICAAVQHAHQRGIIHRDLKPGNILVDETGQPKIVDFGVARVTDVDAQATRQTDSGQILGTLAYMSPEQVLADPLELDTRSDVYALGVILYELLAGRLPYQVGGQLPKAVQTIREEDPARLSSIDRTYRGDIETIVAKALEKEKARRYASAAELGADIERYLKDEPIVARRSTATYYLRKFARRHRALVAGVAAAFVMLMAGVVASTWEAARALRAEREALRQRDQTAAAQQAAQKERDRAVGAERSATAERDRAVGAERDATEERNRAVTEKRHADTEAATAKAISDFLRNDVLAQADSATQSANPDPDLKVRTALDRAAARIAGGFDGQPLVEASIRHTIGQTYGELGVYPEAERQLGRALELRRRSLGEEHADTLASMTALARVCRSAGKYAAAEPLLLKAVETWRRVFGESHRETLAARHELSVLYQRESKFPQAEALAVAVLEARRRTLGGEHRDTVISMTDLGILYAAEGKYPQAEPLLEQALAAARRLDGEEHPFTLDVASCLADLYSKQGKYKLAEPLLVSAIAARRRVSGDEHHQTVAAMVNLGDLYYQTGRTAEAAALNQKVVEIYKRTLGPEHPETLTAMNNLAVNYSSLGRYGESQPLLAQVVEVRRRILGEAHLNTLAARYNLAYTYQAEGRLAEAERLLRENVETATRVLGAEHPDTLIYLLQLGFVLRREEKYADAEPLHTRVVAARKRVLGPEHPLTVFSVISLGLLYQEAGRLAEAESWLTTGLEAGRRVLGTAYGATRSGAESLGRIRMIQKRWAEAEALLRESLNSREAEGPYSWQMSLRRTELGQILMEQSKFAEAEPLLVAGYRGLVERKSAVPATVSIRQAGERIAQLYDRWGRPDQAAQWRKELEAAEPALANSREH